MGFDLDRSELHEPRSNEVERVAAVYEPGSVIESLSDALAKNLSAERDAIDAYRKIARSEDVSNNAALRLAKIALAVEEEHAQILATVMANLVELRG